MRPFNKTKLQSGFTLIELLIVIAIIALLAAILFPVFARARENARRSSCQSNMKQLAMGVLQYVQDYDERMPIYNGGAPMRLIDPYVKNTQIFQCPSARKNQASLFNSTSGSQYGMPYCFSPSICALIQSPADSPGQLISDIPDVTVLCMMGETLNQSNYPTLGHGMDITDSTGNRIAWDRHLEGANWSYMDGHVKWLSVNNGKTGASTTSAIIRFRN